MTGCALQGHVPVHLLLSPTNPTDVLAMLTCWHSLAEPYPVTHPRFIHMAPQLGMPSLPPGPLEALLPSRAGPNAPPRERSSSGSVVRTQDTPSVPSAPRLCCRWRETQWREPEPGLTIPWAGSLRCRSRSWSSVHQGQERDCVLALRPLFSALCLAFAAVPPSFRGIR